jgi:hypothetical protein
MISRLALVVSAAVFLPSAAAAATYYAKPITPISAKRLTLRDISWSCGPAACQGTTDYGRPVVLCQALAQEAGVIESFIIDGRALSVAELERCNRAAPAVRAVSLTRK